MERILEKRIKKYGMTTTTDNTNAITFKQVELPIFKCNICGKKSKWFYGEFEIYKIEKIAEPVLYKPYKFGKRYRICFPCFFKKMGVKP